MIPFRQILLTLVLLSGSLPHGFVAASPVSAESSPQAIAPGGTDATWAALPAETRLAANRPPETDPDSPFRAGSQTAFRPPVLFPPKPAAAGDFPFPQIREPAKRHLARAPPCRK